MKLKRCFDFAVALISLLLLLPVLIVLSVAIYFSMGWPIFFTQIRPGYQGRPFRLVKFRTMSILCDQNGKLLPDDERMTRVGAFIRSLSLDELPQLINVLCGDMSLVGPRPLLMQYLTLYTSQEKRRHEVRPGITGWAQINGRNLISWKKKFELDIWYVENQSFLLDMRILLLTVKKVFKKEGVSRQNMATTVPYDGTN